MHDENFRESFKLYVGKSYKENRYMAATTSKGLISTSVVIFCLIVQTFYDGAMLKNLVILCHYKWLIFAGLVT